MDNTSTLAVEAPSRAVSSNSLALFSLALASFAIGTTEFASMGILQLFSTSLAIDIPTATHAITAYALGVVVGAPVITLAAARLNRRTMLLALMGLFILGNLLSSIAPDITLLVAARFISGLTQGAYFGAGAVVATHIVGPERAGKAFSLVVSGLTVATIFGSPLATFFGQHLGWRETYVAVAGLGAVAFAALWAWIPRSDALAGRPVAQELSALARPRVWWMMSVAAIAVASIFAVYTFIGPFVTDAAGLSPALIPVGLALFGIGMTLGNIVGGRLADTHPARGLIVGFGLALLVLAVLGSAGSNPLVLMSALFGVGFTTMTAIPTIQVRLTRMAPEAPTMMGAMNMASLNLSNAIGAWAGGVVIGAGMGLLATAWAGFALTAAGLAIFALGWRRSTM
ncbi:MFS transporter [Pseudochelatococcus sp. B33]